MTELGRWPAGGLGLADAIRLLRDEPLLAGAAGGRLGIQFARRVADFGPPLDPKHIACPPPSRRGWPAIEAAILTGYPAGEAQFQDSAAVSTRVGTERVHSSGHNAPLFDK